MICRRCGMDSSTTDTCEWCKKPMLPPGGAISAKAKEQILKEKEQPQPAAPEAATPTRAAETEDEASIRRPEAKAPPTPASDIPGLTALGANITEEDTQPQAAVLSTVEQTTNEALLLPLGTHDAVEGDQGSDKTIYVGSEEDVVRPIERPSKDGVSYVIDPSGRKRRVVDSTPEIPDKTRLLRGAVYGSVIAFLGAIIQLIVTHKVPDKAIVIAIAHADTMAGAAMFGLCQALLMGFMFAALLVNFKQGPVLGFLAGLLLGWAVGAQATNSPNVYFGLATGAICGIVVGKASVTGLRRVVNV